MYVAEFDAIVKNGSIEIPAEHVANLPDHVRVTLRADKLPHVDPKGDYISELLVNPLKIPGFVPMTRDEAHER